MVHVGKCKVHLTLSVEDQFGFRRQKSNMPSVSTVVLGLLQSSKEGVQGDTAHLEGHVLLRTDDVHSISFLMLALITLT